MFFNIINFIAKLVQKALLELNPDLEKRQKELWMQEENLQNKRMALNDRLLQTLAEAQGDILQNHVIIICLLIVCLVSNHHIIFTDFGMQNLSFFLTFLSGRNNVARLM